jgi:hypothetical protein
MAVASLCLRWREFKVVTSSPAWLWTVLEVGALAVTILTGLYVSPFLCSLLDGRSQYAFELYVSASGSFPAFGLLIGVLSFERGMLSRILSLRLLVLLGEISFSVYLVHQIIVRWYEAHKGMFTSVPKTMLYIDYWLAVLILSFLIWRAVERPCQQWIRALFRSKRGLVLQNEGSWPHSSSGQDIVTKSPLTPGGQRANSWNCCHPLKVDLRCSLSFARFTGKRGVRPPVAGSAVMCPHAAILKPSHFSTSTAVLNASRASQIS